MLYLISMTCLLMFNQKACFEHVVNIVICRLLLPNIIETDYRLRKSYILFFFTIIDRYFRSSFQNNLVTRVIPDEAVGSRRLRFKRSIRLGKNVQCFSHEFFIE